jgi:hypothetical protein
VKKIVRTNKEIEKYIADICISSDNFTSDNYGTESADNGEFEIYYSEYASVETLKKFVKWLTNKNE